MKHIDDVVISKAIIERFSQKLIKHLDVDVAIAGAGPAGLLAGYDLARNGYKVAIFEKRISIGGGMCGGGMMFNEIVVQKDAVEILRELGIEPIPYDKTHFTADAIRTVSTLASKATEAGAVVFNGIEVEDVLWDGKRVIGFVINWGVITSLQLPVDPLSVRAKYCIDATGHGASVISNFVNKNKINLKTRTKTMIGEHSLWAEQGERQVVENTREVYPGIFVAGMATSAVFGGMRMGPIFGGMLLSGRKAATLIHKALSAKNPKKPL